MNDKQFEKLLETIKEYNNFELSKKATISEVLLIINK